MKTIQFYAYHGTILEFANSIKNSKEFIPGEDREDHWLGIGSYFFREDLEQAKVWADLKVSKHKKFKGHHSAVIEVLIKVAFDKVLNLDTISGINYLKVFLERLQKEGILLTLPSRGSGNKSPELANKVFSLIDPNDKWIIIKTFPVNSKKIDLNKNLMALSFLHKDNLITYGQQGTQVCVKNNNAINKDSINISYRSHTNKGTFEKVKKEEISDEYFNK